MSLFEIEGTVTAIGQSQFDNDMSIYAFIEVTDRNGLRTLIEKVGVFNDIGAVLAPGLSGHFYVDRIYRGSGALRCQLWGVRTDRLVVMDSKDLRNRIAMAKLLGGIPAIFVFGLGLIIIAEAIYLLATAGDRRQFFLSGDGPPTLTPAPEALRI
ncbi:hypothetical protein IVB41_12470 [Bradyrhizobium sp. 44]|uniref:hypothetical protein n=1 Tax=Bradyrhizobium sp. 44 TaxID=2782675 RepID=UPI001FF74EA2|nr:hypothetical protein [Bradyrhizobium sp. 44]MCK1284730.1 hypothetical protein [Bradyrhizobium sp. 44]